jgi:type I restriction enzyme, R subunit
MRDALPNASFIGFTGTPIEKTDANTRAVFGDYISIYDIQRAVADGATVPIYYESRIAKLGPERFGTAKARRGV